MESPHYGYEIKKKLTESVGACTTISNNMLYPILRKYEKKGATTKSIERTAGGQERIIYTLTDIGRQAFVDLLWHFPDSLMNSREEFCTRLSFFPYLNEKARMRVLYLREQFIQNARTKVDYRDEERASLRPHTQKMLAFHEGVLQGEEELIRYFREKMDEPCVLDENGRLLTGQMKLHD